MNTHIITPLVQAQEPGDLSDMWQASTKLDSHCHVTSQMGPSIPR